MQHLLQFDMRLNYDTSLLNDMNVQYGCTVPKELFLVPIWHTSIPDEIVIDNVTYSMDDLFKNSNRVVLNHGLDDVINAMAITSAGEVSN